MADVEKTLKGLECCHKMGVLGLPNCDELECPYFEDRLSCWLDVLSDALELLKEQQGQKEKWIPVTEKLPRGEETVLVTDGSGVFFGYKKKDDVFRVADDWLDVCNKEIRKGSKRFGATHWMPLPEPPKSL